MPKGKRTTDLRDVQSHQEVGGDARTFQELADCVRSSSEEYAAKVGDVAGELYGEIHSKMEKIYWFKNL